MLLFSAKFIVHYSNSTSKSLSSLARLLLLNIRCVCLHRLNPRRLDITLDLELALDGSGLRMSLYGGAFPGQLMHQAA
jgi:hypothetical protein